jgi:hypothetical protein
MIWWKGARRPAFDRISGSTEPAPGSLEALQDFREFEDGRELVQPPAVVFGLADLAASNNNTFDGLGLDYSAPDALPLHLLLRQGASDFHSTLRGEILNLSRAQPQELRSSGK